jgi:hypothetical protein
VSGETCSNSIPNDWCWFHVALVFAATQNGYLLCIYAYIFVIYTYIYIVHLGMRGTQVVPIFPGQAGFYGI